jgi:GxxExxY protein
MTESDLDGLTKRIIGCAYKVSNTLGIGFVEKVYENALVHVLRRDGLRVEQQYPINVMFDGILVGEFFADLLVENCVPVELKAVSDLTPEHLAQALNYLRATGLATCLLINFGKPRIQIRRLYPSPNWNSSNK